MEFEVKGAKLNIDVAGSAGKPAVLFWNGAACTLHMWDLVVSKLIGRFRVIRFDIRGTGASTPTEDPETQYTFEQYAADADQILDAYEVERCHIWSMAWGTRAAIAYCAMHPARVISTSLFDASIGRADVEAQKRGGKRALELQLAAGIEPFPRPEMWNTHQYPEEVPKAMAASRKFDLVNVVPRLTMPVLVATGDHDPNLASSRELVNMLPDARLRVFQNVGHGSVLQRPDLTTEAFLEFQDSVM